MNTLMYKSVSLYCFFALVFLSCQNIGDAGNKEKDSGEESGLLNEVDSVAFLKEHNARNSLDYAGTYQGVLPCADCEGIAIELKISYDGEFHKTMQYRGKDADIFEFTGEYKWNEAGNTIILEGLELPNQYFVTEERLIHLDSDGQRITGHLADHYVLTKTY
jgi:copper homeostasis protein (lipoprotein)